MSNRLPMPQLFKLFGAARGLFLPCSRNHEPKTKAPESQNSNAPSPATATREDNSARRLPRDPVETCARTPCQLSFLKCYQLARQSKQKLCPIVSWGFWIQDVGAGLKGATVTRGSKAQLNIKAIKPAIIAIAVITISCCYSFWLLTLDDDCAQ